MTRALFVISVFVLFMLTPILLRAQEISPREGVLTGDNVRVRKGPSTNHRILCQLRKDSKVKVLASKDDWYEIEMPSRVILWINKTYVNEVKQGAQLKGDITGSNVNVRASARKKGPSEEVVGQVNKGDKVNIVGSKGNWYKISPPKGFTAYISEKYVKVEAEPRTRGPQEITPVQRTGEGQTDTLRRRLSKLEEEIHVKREELESIKRAIEEREKREKELERKLKEAEELYEGYKKKVEELRKKHEEVLRQLNIGKRPRLRYVAEGYVDDIGKRINPPPATHRLRVTWGSPPCYYLKSAGAGVNLDNHLRKRVGVMGEIVEEEWRGKKIEVIRVTRIDRLED